jgi:hypothetical protein
LALPALPEHKATPEIQELKVRARSALPVQLALPVLLGHKATPELRALKVRLRSAPKVPLALSDQPERKA